MPIMLEEWSAALHPIRTKNLKNMELVSFERLLEACKASKHAIFKHC